MVYFPSPDMFSSPHLLICYCLHSHLAISQAISHLFTSMYFPYQQSNVWALSKNTSIALQPFHLSYLHHSLLTPPDCICSVSLFPLVIISTISQLQRPLISCHSEVSPNIASLHKSSTNQSTSAHIQLPPQPRHMCYSLRHIPDCSVFITSPLN